MSRFRRLPTDVRRAQRPHTGTGIGGLRAEPAPGVWYRLWRGFVADHDELMRELLCELTWEQRSITLFGREVMQPRRIAWQGELPYRYSNQTLQPREVSETVSGVLARVEIACGVEFNHVLLNHYRDGTDSMGWHADNERELGECPAVASISLGAARRFVAKARDAGERVDLALGGGDLLLMGGDFQNRYVHAVPKTKRPVGERLSLTFRALRCAPSASRE